MNWVVHYGHVFSFSTVLQAIYSCWRLSEWPREGEGNVVKLLILTQEWGWSLLSPAHPLTFAAVKLFVVKAKWVWVEK